MAQNVADSRDPGAGTVGGLGSVEPSSATPSRTTSRSQSFPS